MKIGILGGGQLARMLSLSAHQLGIETVCIDPKPYCSAKNVTQVITADFFDLNKIEEAFADVDYVTYETENLPVSAIQSINQKLKVLPTIDALKIFQDRLYEKDFLNSLNIPTTDYINVNSWIDIESAIKTLGFPFLIKTRQNGYDGKGQVIVHNIDEAKMAWQNFSNKPSIIEKLVNFDYEISIISVRNQSGQILFWPIILNLHKNGILCLSESPYQNEKLQRLAREYASIILNQLNYVGVMTIEFFCLHDTLITNEVAPRVHNSGHWTIEGAVTSQFENHIRAITNLPLGSTKPLCYSAMINFIGKSQNREALLGIPGTHYHWYNKEIAVGRKLGHLTLCTKEKSQMAANIKKAMELIQW